MTRDKLNWYCRQWWPQYQLEDGERWPENRSLKCHTMLQLMVFCQINEKWDEIPYADLSFALRNDGDFRKKCGLMDSKRQNRIYYLTEKKKRGKKKRKREFVFY